jgi:hypothetical protein
MSRRVQVLDTAKIEEEAVGLREDESEAGSARARDGRIS